MSRSLSPRVPSLVALAGTGVIAGLASGRPELVLLAAPFLLLIGLGLVSPEGPRLEAELALDRDRVLEGQHAKARLTLENKAGTTVHAQVTLRRSTYLRLDPPGPVILRLPGNSRLAVEFRLTAPPWGAHAVGPVHVRARARLGLRQWALSLGGRADVRVFPREQQLRRLIAPLRTQPFLGTHVSRALGEGIEFADVRPFAAGDRARRVNWRATARRGALHVTERHPERASDVVLLLDTFAEARKGASGTLDDAVRAAASLARAHLARRDRVALVDFGGTLHWLEPAFGTLQLYRIIDALLSSEIAFSYAWRAVESIPRRVLPPQTLILAVSPLLDERSLRLIVDLRRRGADVAVVEVSPLRHTMPGPSAGDAVAYRLWGLQRETARARLQRLGIGVAVWQDDDGLGPALEGVMSFRRSPRAVALA